MDHDSITASQAVERYLLDEMSADERELFEAHYFECDVCAEEVRSGSMFISNARAVFAEDERAPKPSPVVPAPPKRPWWTAVMRPVWGIALAGALGIFGVVSVIRPPMGVPAAIQLTLTPDITRGGPAASAPYKKGEPVKLTLKKTQDTGAEGPHVVQIVNENRQVVDEIKVTLTASEHEKQIELSNKKIPPGSYKAVLRPANGTERGDELEYYFILTPK